MDDKPFGYIDGVAEEVRDVFMWLCQDTAILKQKWDFYLGLFAGPTHQEVLEFAPVAFRIIEESLRVDMTMSICRLGDPIGSGSRENLNFRKLESLFVSDQDLKDVVEKFVVSCNPVKLHRDKLIAHSDLKARLKPDQIFIPQVKKSDVDSIVSNAEFALNFVSKKYADQSFGFGLGDIAGSFIYWLKKGTDNKDSW